MKLKKLFYEATNQTYSGHEFPDNEDDAIVAYNELFGKWSFGKPNAIWNKYDKAFHVTKDMDIQDFVGEYIPVRFYIITGNLTIRDCPNLKSLDGLPNLVMGNVTISGCPELKSIQHVPRTPKALKLSDLPITSFDGIGSAGSMEITRCNNLSSLKGLPEELTNLWLVSLEINSLRELPNVKDELGLFSMEKLTSLNGAPEELETLLLSDCPNLKTLKDMPEKLGKLNIDRWNGSLVGIADFVKKIEEIDIGEHLSAGGLGILLLKDKGLKSIGSSQGLPAPFKIIYDYLWDKTGKKDADIFDCQHELIEAGFEAYAEL